jgi:hypothetical protein
VNKLAKPKNKAMQKYILVSLNSEPNLQNMKRDVTSGPSASSSQPDNYLEKLKLVASLVPSTLDHASDILSMVFMSTEVVCVCVSLSNYD